MLVQLNHDTNGKYKEIIALRMNKNEFYNLLANDQYKDAMSSKFKMCFKELPYSRQMKIHIKKNFPFIYKLERRIIGNKR